MYSSVMMCGTSCSGFLVGQSTLYRPWVPTNTHGETEWMCKEARLRKRAVAVGEWEPDPSWPIKGSDALLLHPPLRIHQHMWWLGEQSAFLDWDLLCPTLGVACRGGIATTQCIRVGGTNAV